MRDFSKRFRGDEKGVTLRAVLSGVLLAAWINIWAPYSENIIRSSLIVSTLFPVGAVFPFFVIIIFNILLKRIRPDSAFSPTELYIIFIMGLVATTIPTFGLTGFLLGVISTPYYFASAENQWAEYILRYIPAWLAPGDENHAMEWYYTGLPEGAKIPYEAWAVPLFWWLSFVAVVIFVSYCIIAILRKQWVENERLRFPLLEAPLEMVKESNNTSSIPGFMRNRLFLLGFGISAFIIFWNMGHYFSPMIPVIPTHGGWLSIGRGFPEIPTAIKIPVVGFSFFASLDVLASIWFFYLVSVIQVGIFNRIGFSLGPRDHWCSAVPSVGWQAFGGFVFLVLFGLWRARKHLRDVFRKAFKAGCEVDDSKELLSYRTAVWGLIFGLLYIVGWLHKAGMDYPVIFLFLSVTFIIYVGVSRLVAETGMIYVRAPLTAQSFTQFALGTSSLSAPTMTAIAFSYALIADTKCLTMPAFGHVGKIADAIKQKRRILLAVSISLLVSIGVSIWYTLYLGYTHGTLSYGNWIFNGGNRVPFDMMVAKMRNPFGTDWSRLSFLGIGGLVTAGLTFMRYRFIWWPFHPLGFVIAPTDPVKMLSFSIFLAWMVKIAVVKLGGITLYRRVKPFFIGLILGHFVAAGISFIVDLIWFPGRGHPVTGWWG
ncbi:MAG TPA: hypothetical protein EYP53_05395 [Candidatus Latescibacteria bacterium]|nr:hypothetical protein [Candidatus Latescibacterota bacterium]